MHRTFLRLNHCKTAAAETPVTISAAGQPLIHASASANALSKRIYVSTCTASSDYRNQKPVSYTNFHSIARRNIVSKTILPSEEELFSFTRGRFVSKEQHELSKRHRKFNVAELAQHAARAVQANHCLSITKCPDGMYNRVLLLLMDNGREVIAKIPNPNSDQPHFTTASEVATMTFVSTLS